MSADPIFRLVRIDPAVRADPLIEKNAREFFRETRIDIW
jgi:hypothetical protein